MIAAFTVGVLCKFSKLLPCLFRNHPDVHKHKNRNSRPSTSTTRGWKISHNNQFFETQHKNKLDECVKEVKEAWKRRVEGERKKRSQVERKFLTCWRTSKQGRKINLKIINSKAKAEENESERVRWKLLPYNVSIVCAMTWKVFSFSWILISNKGWKIYGMIIKKFLLSAWCSILFAAEHNDWFLIF